MLVPEFSYYINLGFWYLKLLLVLSFPVVGYVIYRKWLFAVAKEEEIKRLMLLAAEEDARAEEVGYYADVGVNRVAFGYVDEAPVDNGSFVFCPEVSGKSKSDVVVNQCAVCLTPTTRKCSRCKSIRYCSAKCQFSHWREGHKDHCNPPDAVNQTSDAESYQRSQAFKKEKAESPISSTAGSVETENRHLKQSHTHLERNAFYDIGHSNQLQGKSDIGNTDTVQEGRPHSKAYFSSSISSGSSTSSLNGDSSDDASVPEISGSSPLEKSVGCELTDALIVKPARDTKPSGVKGSTITSHSKLNGWQTISSQQDSQKTSYANSNLFVKGCDTIVAKSDASDFWEESLDYSWSDSVKTKSQSANDGLAEFKASIRHMSMLNGKNEKSCHVNGTPHLSFPAINEPSSKAASWSSDVNHIVSSSEMNISSKKATVASKVKLSSLATVLSPQSPESNADVQNFSNLPLLSSNKVDRILSSSDHKSKSRRSSISNGDGTIRNLKVDNVCMSNNGPSETATRSSVCEKVGSSTKSDCTVQSLKCRLVGSLPLNPHVIHSSINSSEKVASSVAKIDVVKSNNKSIKSDKINSLKVASLKTSTWKAVEHFKASNMCGSRCCVAGERHDNKGLFSYELFKSLYGWNQVELRPRGLVNCGNSCYVNAVLQCLSFTPPLTAYLLQGLHSKSCTKRDWCFTCEFENLILKAKDGNSPISPIGIISQLPNIGGNLRNGREEDAHEFLRYVVDAMESICMKEAISKVSGTVEEETTLLGLTFGGYLQSKIRCLKCGDKSERSERIMDLSVEIEGSIRSLDDALKRFTFAETLDAENKYNCVRCKSYQKAKKKLTVLEAPNILTIALKRFQVGKFGKLNKWIDFPEVLNMAPYMSQKSDDKAPVYKLYGVIVHLDTMNATFSGHYVCYVKNIQNKWFLVDDSVVKTVEFGTVKKQEAYMLLYARCLPRAPKSLRDKVICNSKAKVIPHLTGHTPMSSGPKSPDFDHATSSEVYCNKHHGKFETDSYSDDCSLFSSCSGYSCSTDSSIRESNSADDLSDLIFGDSVRGLRYMWKSSSDSDSASPSSSPFYSGHDHAYNQAHLENSGGTNVFCANLSSDCRKVDFNRDNSSNIRLQEMEKLTDLDNVRYGVPSRRFFGRRV